MDRTHRRTVFRHAAGPGLRPRQRDGQHQRDQRLGAMGMEILTTKEDAMKRTLVTGCAGLLTVFLLCGARVHVERPSDGGGGGGRGGDADGRTHVVKMRRYDM